MFKNSMASAVATALACAFTLSACGGGGGGEEPAQKAPAVAAQPVAAAATRCPTCPVLIESYGDSTTLGLQIINGVQSYTANTDPVDLQNLLRQQFGSMVEVSNQGVSGTQALQLLNGTDQNHAAWAAQMAASKASIVTLNFARNDADYYGAPTPGMTPVSPEQYGQIMTQLVQIAKAAGKQVVLYEPDPVAFSDGNIAVAKYVAQLKAVATAEQVPIVFQWEYAQGLPDYASLLTDGVHPTDSLYAFNAQWESQVIAPLVQALLR